MSSFAPEVLSEKLVKLNASQQSIENLSHWCIFHRNKAKHIVKTWEKEFFIAPKDKRVSFLYLANDIIQNSRRKGLEFVHEFWKVLSSALKDVKTNGDDNGRNAVSRLINIWEERKVFGPLAQSLREVLLGDNGPSKKHEKIDKELEHQPSKRPKIENGGTFHKVIISYKEVNEGLPKEDATLEECSSASRRISVLENEATSHVVRSSLADELEEQEKSLRLIMEELRTRATTRSKLVNHLKEATREQEQKLEHIDNQIQDARLQAEHVRAFRQRLSHPVRTTTEPSTEPRTSYSRWDIKTSVSGRSELRERTEAAPDDLESRKEGEAAAIAAEVAQFDASSGSVEMLSPSLLHISIKP